MKEAKLHITVEEMQLYIKNELPDHHRQRVELEIQLCEACLESFIYWNSMVELAYMPQSNQAAEHISTVIEERQALPRRKWIQHPLAQVVVAASITLLLVGSGAMGMITSSLSGFEEARLEQQTEPNTEHYPPNQQSEDAQGSDDMRQGGGAGDSDNSEPSKSVDEEKNRPQSSSERWLNKAAGWIQKIQNSRFE